MSNPFQLRWLQGWTFQIVLMEGKVQVEAQGFGICLRTALLHGESPSAAADRLVLAEDQRRQSLRNAWMRGQQTSNPSEMPLPPLEHAIPDISKSLVVGEQDLLTAV